VLFATHYIYVRAPKDGKQFWNEKACYANNAHGKKRDRPIHGAVRVLSDAAIWSLTLFVCVLVTCVICLSIANHPECANGTKHSQIPSIYIWRTVLPYFSCLEKNFEFVIKFLFSYSKFAFKFGVAGTSLFFDRADQI